jgi:endonuclease/exonuclease/phosphatase family metal-dependent hydrolase
VKRIINRLFRGVGLDVPPTLRTSSHALPDVVAQASNRPLTIMSANLWHDWPRFRRLPERLETFARLVEEERADILLLQEVTRTATLHADIWLAERLGMTHAFTAANGREQNGFEEGVAILSRFPLEKPQVCELRPRQAPFIRRLALAATLKTPIGDLLAVSTHLGQGRRRNAGQLAHLRRWVAGIGLGRPAVIGGDFNAREKTIQIRQAAGDWIDLFRRRHPTADATTYELRWPWGTPLARFRFDYLFLRSQANGWRILDARHLPDLTPKYSDHRAVLAKLHFPVPAWHAGTENR